MAAQNGHSEVVDILLRVKANLNLPADDGTTPLDIARQNGHSNVVSALQKGFTSEEAEVTETAVEATVHIQTRFNCALNNLIHTMIFLNNNTFV